MPAHPIGRNAPRRAKALTPLHHARYAHSKQHRCRPARAPASDRGHNPIPQICRIGSCHPCWPPTPASILNQKTSPRGIPFSRFRPTESCSRHLSPRESPGSPPDSPPLRRFRGRDELGPINRSNSPSSPRDTPRGSSGSRAVRRPRRKARPVPSAARRRGGRSAAPCWRSARP